MKSILAGFIIASVALLFSTSVFADGDAAKGKRVFNKCKTCHTLKEGRRKIGPHLQCIIGKPAGTVEGFKYSKAMAASGLTWDKETLSKYLVKPKDLVKGTKMTFAGIRKPQQIEDVIAYIEANAMEGC